MFVGHFAVGFAAKRFAPKASLGTLLLAAQFADVLWPVMLLLGVEHARIVPGIMKVSAFDFYDYPLTHSLFMDVIWGAVLAGIYYAIKRYRAGAIVVFIGVVSHWFLDVIVHRPDLPLMPESSGKIGFGLWNSLPATLFVEGAIFAAGLLLYLRSTHARDRGGVYGFWPMVLLLVLIWISSLLGPAPPSMTAVAIAGILGSAIVLIWGYWIDRHRPAVQN